jgi:hypothetical protein
MKKPFRTLVAFLIVGLLSISSTGQAKDWKSKKKSPTAATDTSDRITAVHLMSITINIYATQSQKEYQVTPATKITLNGQPSQLSGLATGMNVIVTPAPDGATAVAIDAKTAKR